MQGKTFTELREGDSAEFAKTLSETDVYLFAGITGDFNPAHVNRVHAEQTAFKGRIAHGILVAGLVSTVIGTRLPGPGTIYMAQDFRFLAPVYMGDTITARVEVTELLEEKKRVRLKTTCVNAEGKTVLDGSALVSPPRGGEG
jgi:3-hydroxybutyryl-CoA dehydratase